MELIYPTCTRRGKMMCQTTGNLGEWIPYPETQFMKKGRILGSAAMQAGRSPASRWSWVVPFTHGWMRAMEKQFGERVEFQAQGA